MEHIDYFLNAWRESQDIEAFLLQKIELPDSKVIRDHLDTLSPSERESVEKELSSIVLKLESHAEEMAQGLKETQDQLSNAQNAQEMCVSYEKAEDINKGKTDK